MDEKIVFTPFEVIHDKMGKGTAIGYSEKEETTYIKIRFSSYEIQDFVFPDQFQWHLKATDPEIQSQIEKNIKGRPAPVQKSPILRRGFSVSHRAIDTYDFGCRKFNWNSRKRGCFDRKKILYAANATPENYAVWCLPHNNLVEEYNENQNWYNYIFRDYIEEVWFVDKSNFYNDNSIRVTFIKNKNNHYEFFGIFTPIKHETRNVNGKARRIKIYQRISSEYPT